MTRWLQAAKAGRWRTDTLTELTESTLRASKGAAAHAGRGFCQYRQTVSTTSPPSETATSEQVPSVLSVRQYDRTRDGGMSSAIGDAVVLAFKDYLATDDPRDPRAWT